MADTTFDRHDIWPTRHLADTTFGRHIWPTRHLADTTFGRHDESLHDKSTLRHIVPSLLDTVCWPIFCRPSVFSAKFLSANCLSAKYRVCQMSCRPNVVSAKFHVGQISVGQMSCRRNFMLAKCMSAKCRVGQRSCRPNFVSAKYQVCQMFVGQMSCRPNVVSAKFCVGQMSCRPNVCRPTAVAPLELSNILIQSLPLSHRYDKKYYFRKRRVSVERKFRCYSTQ